MTRDVAHTVSNSFPFGVSLYRHTAENLLTRSSLVLRDAHRSTGRATLARVRSEMCLHPEMFTFPRQRTAALPARSSEYHYALAFVTENILVL